MPRLWAGVLAAVVVGVVVCAGLALDARPPGAVSSSAPAAEFSAERAAVELRWIAGKPRPLGSAESDRVRDRLADRLRGYGMDVRVDEGLGGFAVPGVAAFGRVENVVGVLPGTDPTGTVVLAAHYDSVEAGPGASDDGAGVAAILETVRALRASGPMRNDLVVLLTDGEESGLLGASAFRYRDPLADRSGVVLNYEARGTSGPSTLFETSPGNADLVRTFAHVAPHPYGDSAAAALYQLLPNDTDFSEFRRAGFAGLNFAYSGGAGRYHTPQDSIAHTDLDSVQHHGANMLALGRALGDTDLSAPRDEGDATFFRLLGLFVSYPDAAVLPAAVGGVLLVAAAAAVARRMRLLSLPRLVLGALSVVLPIAVATGLGLLLTAGLVAVRPGYGAIMTGAPYRAGWYELALAALAVGAVLAWYVLLRRRLGPAALAVGALAWPALAGLACALLLPAAAYLFTVPAVAGGMGALGALALRTKRWPAVAVLAVCAVPGVAMMTGFGHGLADTGLLDTAPVAATAYALAVLVALPMVEWACAPVDLPDPRRLAVLAPVLALVVAVGGAGVGLGTDGFDAEHPRPAHLAYVLDAGTRTARWVSADEQPAPWTRGYVTTRGEPPLPYREEGATQWLGRAPALDDRPPDLRVVDRTDDSVELHVTSPRRARTVVLVLDRAPARVTAEMAGRPRLGMHVTEGDTGMQVRLLDVPASGATLTLHGTVPRQVTAFDQTEGLDEVPDWTPRPRELQRSAMQDSDQVIVGRVYRI